ncbi:hypothetical protein AWZ03_003888 [Drosophila navojoa]|uniref:Uncharacterized protein n=1 Tax=Drosophila navojoa TaxID=7232 RepID=A0A484BNM9_DRONA|nr:hypothetical protein AWZ03_003888 [Drosophila navojoa]
MTDMCFDCNVPIRVCIPISKCIENFCSMSTKFLATSDITMPQRDQCAGALVKAADHMSSPAPSIESACKFKADVDSKASLMCDLQDLNESNIEEMMEDMKKCCNQTQSNSKLPLLLLPFPLNGGTDEGMGTICQPDEWQEIDESQLPNILNSVSQRPSEGFDNSSQSPEVDKSGVIKPNEASIEVDKEIGFQTSLNADERDNQRNQAVAKDKDVVVLMKMRKMRRTSRGVADINELKSNKKPDAVDRRERPQMLQQEQPPRRLPQEQQMQAQPYQRSNGYATLDQYYQQLRADYEPQQQCFSSWRVMPQPVHPPDTQRSGAARNITESFYQHTLSKYGVPCMPRHFSNSNCD